MRAYRVEFEERNEHREPPLPFGVQPFGRAVELVRQEREQAGVAAAVGQPRAGEVGVRRGGRAHGLREPRLHRGEVELRAG